MNPDFLIISVSLRVLQRLLPLLVFGFKPKVTFKYFQTNPVLLFSTVLLLREDLSTFPFSQKCISHRVLLLQLAASFSERENSCLHGQKYRKKVFRLLCLSQFQLGQGLVEPKVRVARFLALQGCYFVLKKTF